MSDVIELRPVSDGLGLSDSEICTMAKIHPLLAALDPKSLETVLNVSRTAVYRPKRTVQREGDAPNFVYFILDGLVRMYHRHEEGEITTQLLRGPCLFNDSRAITESPVSECASTLARSTILAMPAEVFRRLLTLRPCFCEAVLKDSAARQCITSDHIRRLSFDDIDTRLANLLIDYVEVAGSRGESGIRIDLPCSQQSMALDVGASRKSLNRSLERLRDAGAIKKENARYEILDMKVVEAQASDALGIRFSSDSSHQERLRSHRVAANPLE